MSGALLSARDRRTIAVGATVVMGLVGVLRGLPAWRAWRADARAAAVEMLSRAGRTEAVLAGSSQALDTLEVRTARLRQVVPALLAGETPAEAASMLTAVIADVARRSLVRLDAMEVRVDTSDRKSLPRVSLDAQATADVRGLASLLYSLERGPTLLAVRRLVVQPANVQSPPDQIENLSIRLTVEGLALVRKRGGER